MRARNLKLTVVPAFFVWPLALVVAVAATASGGDAAADGREGGVSPISPITGRDRDASVAQVDAAATRREASFVISKTLPDPPALSERQQWVFDLRWDRGDIYLLEVHKVDMGGPHPTPRVMGRFALELFEGPTVIERVRFDFPMLGAPEATDGGVRTAPRFEPKLRTRIGVLFPATTRGTKLELWDRANDVRIALPWPPIEGPATAPDAGKHAF